MKMPNNEQSFVEDKKITHYLLSDTHSLGKHKAKFFKSFGFKGTDIETFKSALIAHAIEKQIEESEDNGFGKKFELKCDFQTPDSRNPCIVSVWIIEKGNTIPKLVTAYPEKK